MSQKIKQQWWQKYFGHSYLKTYVDVITQKRTVKEVDFIVKVLKLSKEVKILDLACGHGRHSIELAKRGYKVTGFDYSRIFINIAKQEARSQNLKIEFVRGDMRQLPFKNKFDAVINMFSSFGYFADEKDHIRVLKKVFEALRPKGQFLIDLNNPVRSINLIIKKGRVDKKSGLITMIKKEKLSNGIAVTIKNQLDFVNMRWLMEKTWREAGKSKNIATSVRLFTLPEMKNLLEGNGLVVEKVWGDFNGSPYGLASRRMIILAKRI